MDAAESTTSAQRKKEHLCFFLIIRPQLKDFTPFRKAAQRIHPIRLPIHRKESILLPSARVVNIGQNHVWIIFDDETAARPAELRKTKAREMLVPGDRVLAERREDGSAFVRERLERRSRLERVTPAGRTKIMAANIDTVLIAAAFDRPALNLQMLDELLAFSELHELEAMLALSKADLVPLEKAEALTQCYRALGYATFLVDARRLHGTAELGSRLASHETLIVGASGVGKSTIFAALGGEAVIGDVSERTGQGRQTTTSGRLLRFPQGALIDSPGIGEFSLEGVDLARLASLWIEFRPYLGRCRFPDCRHLEEPECAVLAAVSAGAVTAARYQSYRSVSLRLKESAARKRYTPTRAEYKSRGQVGAPLRKVSRPQSRREDSPQDALQKSEDGG